jgi:LCP family protein required for cell wall assembly
MKRSRSKVKKRKRKLIILMIELLLLIFLAAILFLVIKLSRIDSSPLDTGDILTNEGISSESQEIMSDYKTIALFGLDNRSTNSLAKGNSDVIMIAAINNSTKEVKLLSVYRDSYLDIGDGVYRKCNYAYAKGGPEQAINMLNTNLDLGITDYVTVDFNAIIEAIDLLGGVEITITDEEADLMWGYIQELNRISGNDSVCPDSGGTYTLDGVQATAYARIRFTAGNDYKRTERQRTVLSAMIKKAQKSNIVTLNKLINTMFDDILTSFSLTDMLSLAAGVFDYSLAETSAFPAEKTSHNYGGAIGDVVIPCDLSSNVTTLHQFLYDDENYTPSDTVKSRSEELISMTGYRQGDGA